MASAKKTKKPTKVPDEAEYDARIDLRSQVSCLVTTSHGTVTDKDVEIAVRAASAKHTRLYELPDLLKKALEARADDAQTKITPDKARGFVDVYRQVVEVPKPSPEHSNVFRNPCFATNPRKETFFRQMNTKVWPAVIAFRDTLAKWHDDWVMSDARARGSKVPGADKPPSTRRVCEAARAVETALVEALSGFYYGVAYAYGHEAERVRRLLDIPELPAALGCETRDDVLCQLGVGVHVDLETLENDLVFYLHQVRHLDQDPVALAGLVTFGAEIAWEKLA